MPAPLLAGMAVISGNAFAQTTPASGPAPGPAARVSWASPVGGRNHCPADTTQGVILARSAGEAPCLLGKTWGYDDQGIWVSDGCRGEFLVGHELPKASEKQEAKRGPPEYIPNAGFLLVEGDKGEMYVRLFSYVRYLNQQGLDPAYTDSFGTVHTVKQREDVQLNKFFLPFSGWFLQEGTDIHNFLKILGDKVGRVALFGIPLQQIWSYGNTGDFAPLYYLQTDAPLYYYSFTDAAIAMAYRSLSKEEPARFDPIITGFNPTDMYAAGHIRRVLKTFPGVFSGIGEFTIHKECVSAKIAGETASLLNPAFDRILGIAGEAGVVVILHNDVDMPFPKPGQDPYMVVQLRDLLQRHPETTVIWAHIGLGRIVHPVKDQLTIMERALANPKLNNLLLDISWDEVAKYLLATPETPRAAADLINRHPDRFLFWTDEVAPADQARYLRVFEQYAPLFARLTPVVSEKVRKGNYERVFDEARRKVRAWEKEHVH